MTKNPQLDTDQLMTSVIHFLVVDSSIVNTLEQASFICMHHRLDKMPNFIVQL